MCWGREESWEHVWEKCRDWKEGGESWQEPVDWVLGEKGRGEGWMRELERERERRVEGGGRVRRGGMNEVRRRVNETRGKWGKAYMEKARGNGSPQVIACMCVCVRADRAWPRMKVRGHVRGAKRLK